MLIKHSGHGSNSHLANKNNSWVKSFVYSAPNTGTCIICVQQMFTKWKNANSTIILVWYSNI